MKVQGEIGSGRISLFDVPFTYRVIFNHTDHVHILINQFYCYNIYIYIYIYIYI